MAELPESYLDLRKYIDAGEFSAARAYLLGRAQVILHGVAVGLSGHVSAVEADAREWLQATEEVSRASLAALTLSEDAGVAP